jgi:predicted DNA-binding protein
MVRRSTVPPRWLDILHRGSYSDDMAEERIEARTAKTKAMTLRLPADQAAELEAVARADGKAVSESVREAIDTLIAERRKDKEFQARLRKMVEENQAILDRLAR